MHVYSLRGFIFIQISAEREFYHFELSGIEQTTVSRDFPYTSKTTDLLSKSIVSVYRNIHIIIFGICDSGWICRTTSHKTKS